MSKEALKLKTAAEKVVELCSERPLFLGKWLIDMSEACESLREALAEQPAQPEQEFIKHHGDDEGWSEWVCPDPDDYLISCCDCGLVHEAEFGVVRYKSETEREDCDRVDDPNLQAVFRMRRSERWSPEDTTHRAGGLPMEQPAQRKPLTDEEISEIAINNPPMVHELARAIEAKLRSKNEDRN